MNTIPFDFSILVGPFGKISKKYSIFLRNMQTQYIWIKTPKSQDKLWLKNEWAMAFSAKKQTNLGKAYQSTVANIVNCNYVSHNWLSKNDRMNHNVVFCSDLLSWTSPRYLPGRYTWTIGLQLSKISGWRWDYDGYCNLNFRRLLV